MTTLSLLFLPSSFTNCQPKIGATPTKPKTHQSYPLPLPTILGFQFAHTWPRLARLLCGRPTSSTVVALVWPPPLGQQLRQAMGGKPLEREKEKKKVASRSTDGGRGHRWALINQTGPCLPLPRFRSGSGGATKSGKREKPRAGADRRLGRRFGSREVR
jgi:hypothetical protein